MAELFADGLAGAFERAVLREALLQHRHGLQSAIQWIDGRLAGLAADAVTTAAAEQPSGEFGIADPLTPREAEVIGLLARGLTNLAIAKVLVVREGTVKYHVKNILRKLGATSRADAVARYARANLQGIAMTDLRRRPARRAAAIAHRAGHRARAPACWRHRRLSAPSDPGLDGGRRADRRAA